jgi:ribonuclease/clavin/mitogillin
MTSLLTLKALKPAVLYPGHGPHIQGSENAQAHISRYISHRQDREDEIVKILKSFAEDSSSVGRKVKEFQDKIQEDKAKENKYYHEYLSGKPYVPKVKKGPTEAKVEDKASKPDATHVGGSQQEVTRGKARVDKDDEEEEVLDHNADAPPIESRFPDTQQGIPISLLCRFIYQTDNENKIFAATKSIGAHLDKLEKEGKVYKTMVTLPKLVEGKVLEEQEQEGWWWAEEIHAEESIKVE